MTTRTFYSERVKQLPAGFADTISSIMRIISTMEDIEKVIMFGSCSRNTQTDKSDIDLLLLLNSNKSCLPYSRLEEKVGLSIFEQFNFSDNKPVDLLFADEPEFNNSTRIDSVYHYIKRDGVVLYE